MNIKNKALAVISALMLCIVLFSGLYPVKVSAAEAKPLSDLEQYYLSGGTGDMTGVRIKEYDEKVSTVKYPKYAGTVGKYKSSDNDTRHYAYYDLTDPISRFKLACYGIFYHQFRGGNKPEEREFYYLYNFGTTLLDGEEYHIIRLIYSFSPMRFELENDKYILKSDSEIYFSIFQIRTSGDTVSALYNRDLMPSSSGSYSSEHLYYSSSCTDFTNSFVYLNGSAKEIPITWQEIYSNCDMEINGHKFRNDPFQNLENQIDVKLTPEFGLDMDRVFDKNTGQNDYFKFEVTNNSNTNIQFCASIIDEKGNLGDTLDKALSGTIFEGALIFDYTEWEDGYWNYITDSQHYVDCYEESSKLLVLKKYRRYPELQKGNFYWVLLKPGDHFEDFIYWENVKINPNKKYSFVVDCIPTELEYSTDIFYSSEGETKVFSHPDEILDIGNIDIDDYEKDSTLERYALNYKECKCVYNQVFSVTSIPDFTTNVRGGNSKITSGWNDTLVQSNNPYYRQDLSNGEIKPVENYSEFNGSLDSVNVDISNIKFSDIGSYVILSQDYFNVIKNVISVFPSWIWITICFGLTGLIVIGIIKAIL